MIVWDVVAALAISLGGFLGARKGLWRMATGAGAVALGLLVGAALCDALADALRAIGVGHTGSIVLGFFLPFALVSVYARYLAGLWLSRAFDRMPDRNRILGAVAGVVWMALAVGLVARVAWCRDATVPAADDLPRGAPFVSWLARYPGALGASAYLGEPDDATEQDRAWSQALEQAFDSNRLHTRTREADLEAAESLHRHGANAGACVAGDRNSAPSAPTLNQR
jgi:hypothetical protein